MKVRIRFQDMKEVEGQEFPIQFINQTTIEVENFNLLKIVGIINGSEVDAKDNKLTGFMIGDNNYFRALEVISVEVLPNEEST